MNADIKRKWIKALRSGEYKQARGILKEPDREAYCCLGVLADIQGIDWKTVDDLIDETLPRDFNAGVTKKQREILAAKNDGVAHPYSDMPEKKHTFKQIANYIEKHL